VSSQPLDLHLYDRADQSSELRQEIATLQADIATLQKTVSEADIQRKLFNALNQVAHHANRLVPQLDAEWPEAPITLRAMKENARQGFWNGARPPIGYRVVEAGQRGAKIKKTLEIDPLQAETVRTIYRWTN